MIDQLLNDNNKVKWQLLWIIFRIFRSLSPPSISSVPSAAPSKVHIASQVIVYNEQIYECWINFSRLAEVSSHLSTVMRRWSCGLALLICLVLMTTSRHTMPSRCFLDLLSERYDCLLYLKTMLLLLKLRFLIAESSTLYNFTLTLEVSWLEVQIS